MIDNLLNNAVKFTSNGQVALTAHAAEENRTRCLESGMDDFFAKPYKPTELRTLLEDWPGPPH